MKVRKISVRNALFEIEQAHERLRALVGETHQRLAAAGAKASVGLDDGDLSEEGRNKIRARELELRDAEREKINTEIAEVRQTITAAREVVAGYVRDTDAARAADPQSALVEEMRVQRGWDTARAMLDTGHDIQEVLSFAAEQGDADMLAALRLRAPAYMQMMTPRDELGHREPADARRLVRKIDEALVPLLPEQLADARTAAMRLDDLYPAVEYYADSVEQLAAGTAQPLEVALGARVYGFDQVVEPESVDA